MINCAVFMGRLAQEPELKTTLSGTPVCSFSLAVQRNYKKEGEEYKTDWIDCVAWKGAAEFICKYFRKGELIALKGEIQTRTYKDGGGKTRKATELIVEQASFCGSNTERAGNMQQPAVNYQDIPEIDEGDLPF